MLRKYSPSASEDVKREMHAFKKGKLKSGKGGKGGIVKNPEQAIAIALSEARKKARKFRRLQQSKQKTLIEKLQKKSRAKK